MPEVRQALMNQPVGSVNGIELRADGSAALLTDRGPVEVGLSAESRGTIQDVYRGLAVLAPALPGAAGQAPLQVARGVSGGIPSLVVPASRLG
jgi:hypothetical protein